MTTRNLRHCHKPVGAAAGPLAVLLALTAALCGLATSCKQPTGTDPGAKTGLTVSITSTAPDPTCVSPIPITVTFSEEVTGFIADEISASGGGSAANLQTSDNIVFTADVTPGGQGLVTINVGADACQDLDGNPNKAASPLTRTYDTVKPSVSITSPTQSRTGANPIAITIAFDEAVTGFTAGDLTVGGGTAGAVAGGPSVYTCGITPTAPGTVTVDLPADKCQDAATNTNKAATQLTRTSITSLGYGSTFSTPGANALTFTLANVAVAGNSNRVLIAEVCARSDTTDTPIVSGVTYGGTDMTLVPGSTITYTNNNDQVMVAALYYLKNPTEGTASVVATLSASANVQTAMLAAIWLYDACVHGGNDPIGAVATYDNGVPNGSTACTSITTTSDCSWLVDVVTGNFTSVSFTPGALQTTRWAYSVNNCGAGSTKPVNSACSTTMSWTLGTVQTWRILQSTAEIKIAR